MAFMVVKMCVRIRSRNAQKWRRRVQFCTAMEWDDLRYVLAIARGKTLSVAAAKLNVSHTTVGRRLRTIEKRLSVRLFDQKPDIGTSTYPVPSIGRFFYAGAKVKLDKIF